jgi:molybdenum-dependent DNA-binding transcriptional regulator ModE
MGGATQLTELGLAVLKHYHSIADHALVAVQKELHALEATVRDDGSTRRPERT